MLDASDQMCRCITYVKMLFPTKSVTGAYDLFRL